MAERFPYVRRLINFRLPLSGSSSSAKDFSAMTQDLGYVLTTWEFICATLVDADELDIQKESVKCWLREVKRLAYEGEDVLDTCEYELMHIEVEETEAREVVDSSNNNIVTPIEDLEVRIFIPSLLNIAFFRENIPSMAEIFRKKIEVIGELRKALDLKEGYGKKPSLEVSESRPSSSLPTDDDFFGRDGDKERLIGLLQSNNDTPRGVTVIAVVGLGGLGKTTLVQHVYNDPSSINGHFDLTGWVCVSTDSDVVKLTKAVLKSLKRDSEKESCNSLDLLQVDLKDAVNGKKFLLVLDDVWDDSLALWGNLFTPLRYGAKGSRVLITTRNEKVAHAMRAIEHFKLECLSKEDSWVLFKRFAFTDNKSSGVKQVELEEIGKGIVEKCKGLPLAIKLLGCLLWGYKNNSNKWTKVLNSDLWDTKVGEEEIIGSLRLSYFYLPSYLKPCFRFCSIFHKDCVISKDRLVSLWMANYLIQSDEPKDIGMSYIDELLSRSFFQPVVYYQGIENVVVMHDLIHDLARYTSNYEYECQTIMEGGEEKFAFGYFHGSYNLRTLLDSNGSSLEVKNCKGLRALHLNKCETSFPQKLIHLRYLAISYCSRLNSITSLSCLQTLEIRYSSGLNSISTLPCLQTLKIVQCSGLNSISTLPQLHTLGIFVCSGLNSISTLPQLHTLHIFRCSGLNSIPTLPCLQTLLIGCSGLNSIPTLPCLHTLEILNCSGLNSIPTPPCLQTLEIGHCPKLKSLPMLSSSSSSSLRCVEIHGCDSLTSIALPVWDKQQPDVLEEVSIGYCDNLESIENDRH